MDCYQEVSAYFISSAGVLFLTSWLLDYRRRISWSDLYAKYLLGDCTFCAHTLGQ